LPLAWAQTATGIARLRRMIASFRAFVIAGIILRNVPRFRTRVSSSA
jgi:hypothetical protein